MAILGFIIGSCLGGIASIVAWAALDLSFFQAFSLYLACGVGLGLTMAVWGCLQATVANKHAVPA